MKRAITIIIGFVHDFAAGCWGACVLAVYWLHRLEDQPGLQQLMLGLKKQFFFAGLACFAIVLAAGAGRTFTYAYVGNVYGEDAEKLLRKMLIIKHTILLVMFGLGTGWQYSMVFG
jgi:putative copper export protein